MTTPPEEVTVDVDGRLAVLTIDRPYARNAIGLGTIGMLDDAISRLSAEDVSALVIRGAGDRAFVSGGDLKELAAIRDVAGATDMASRMRNLLDRIATFPVPVIAALNGHALGGGAEVAIAADMRIAADDVKIGFNQVTLGIMPAWGGAERLAEVVGAGKALMMIASGQIYGADEAHALGLLDVVVEREEFEARWRAAAARLAELTPTAARSIKSAVTAARPRHHPGLAADAVASFANLWVSDEHWDAVDRLRAGARAGS